MQVPHQEELIVPPPGTARCRPSPAALPLRRATFSRQWMDTTDLMQGLGGGQSRRVAARKATTF